MIRRISPLILVAAFGLLLGGCAVVDYDNVPRGNFEGEAVVVWVGPGQDSNVGDGRFLYVPVEGNELVFWRSGADGKTREIRPEAFYTDGGSVPRSVQSLRGFNAWGYGPAYVIHDWIFRARKCLNDEAIAANLITDEMRKINGMSFRESAIIMAETIRTLVDDYEIDGGHELSGPIISNVTAGPLTHAYWTAKGTCASEDLTASHRAVVEELQGRRSALRTRSPLDAAKGAELMQAGSAAYRVIGTFSFE
ncbi:Protein of unknown function [Poseidonocella pacifica]|uniref:DUF1353 domain-containing protein n=1 Tax=Poseidonocella pacifica TaxID=871651 RepID=A0A1I0V230_9RHOB|nr:DUF1353 domain-containing protein [Poseidonocella pacifica]SFA70384.1 Protein of unknown function [Poseidonocella pacifica]